MLRLLGSACALIRRAMKFRLRTLFALVAVIAVCAFVPAARIHENRAARSNGGVQLARLHAPRGPWIADELPFWISRHFWPRYRECIWDIKSRDGVILTDDDLKDLPFLRHVRSLDLPEGYMHDIHPLTPGRRYLEARLHLSSDRRLLGSEITDSGLRYLVPLKEVSFR